MPPAPVGRAGQQQPGLYRQASRKVGRGSVTGDDQVGRAHCRSGVDECIRAVVENGSEIEDFPKTAGGRLELFKAVNLLEADDRNAPC